MAKPPWTARIRARLRRLGSSAPPAAAKPNAGAAQQRAAERLQMLQLLPEGAVCAEIGTWRGDFSAVILQERRPRSLTLVDPWEHRDEEAYAQASYGGRMQGGQEALDEMHDSVRARFAQELADGTVTVLRMRSTDAAASLPDGSLDWVYIDGDHSYEGVKADLEAYFPKVRPGGFIAGDDYGHQGSWFEDGVTRAVEEFRDRCAELQVIGTQFVLRKP
jgi:hypothetical protein